MGKNYTYDPGCIMDGGKDRMRFELGDTMVEGRSATCALTDEEIDAALSMYPGKWKRAKLALLESIFRRFSFEVDIKEGPLSLSLSERAKLWKDEYEKLKKEVSVESITVPSMKNRDRGKRPYFYTGMMRNPEAGRHDKR